jgi:hypothetical protein
MKLCLAPAGGVEIGTCPPNYVPAFPTRAVRHQHIPGTTFSKMKRDTVALLLLNNQDAFCSISSLLEDLVLVFASGSSGPKQLLSP